MENTFRFSVVSVFCGAGGSSLGYEQAGGKVLLAVDNWPSAVETYRMNFPETPTFAYDIAKLSVEECCRLAQVLPGQLGILDGSPPCQGFSMIGGHDFADRRNRLYEEFVRLLRGLRPKAFVMENVSGMVKGHNKLIFADCLRAMKHAGYRVRARLLNVAYFGVPQDRRRIIFVGVREDLGIEPCHPRRRGNRGRSARRSDWSATVRSSRTTSSATATPGAASNQPCPALTKHAPLLVLDGDVRPLTPTECGVLSGFPADFRWGRSAHRLIGNAVPPPFMRAIAEHVRDNVLGVVDSGRHDSSAVHAAPETPTAGESEHGSVARRARCTECPEKEHLQTDALILLLEIHAVPADASRHLGKAEGRVRLQRGRMRLARQPSAASVLHRSGRRVETGLGQRNSLLSPAFRRKNRALGGEGVPFAVLDRHAAARLHAYKIFSPLHQRQSEV